MLPTLSHVAILRVLRCLLAAELARLSRREITATAVAGWGADLRLGAGGLGLDSLERMGLSAAVSGLFHLHEVPQAGMLLSLDTLGEWAALVQRALRHGTSGLSFRSSGSTGAPRAHTHTAAVLAAETAFWAARFQGCRQIVQLVPAHHIYGFLFTVALPQQLGIPVLDGRALPPAQLRVALAPGSLLVGFPLGLRQLLVVLPVLPPGLQATTSTAPMPPGLHQALREAGIDTVHQIYGSSETAGIGLRTEAEAPFTLLPRWRPGAGTGTDVGASLHEVATGTEWPLPDHAGWTAGGALHLHGRRDAAVQVGGVNVYPAQVAEVLRGQPGVADCAIRLDETLPEPRLKAFVVPASGMPEAALREALDHWCRRHFAAPQRPVHFTFGAALPRSPSGKARDWAGGAGPR